MPTLHLAIFQAEATPPLGHPCAAAGSNRCAASMIRCAVLGVVLLGAGAPVVLCAVDWCGLRNDANRIWRQALAKAAHTTPERVALQCVHPHNAPFADVEAQRLLEQGAGRPAVAGSEVL